MQCRCTKRRQASQSRTRASFQVLQRGARVLGLARGTKAINEVERRDGKTRQIGRIGRITLQMKNQTFVITAEVDESSGTKILEVLQEGPRA